MEVYPALGPLNWVSVCSWCLRRIQGESDTLSPGSSLM
ncbi:rCG30796 [Rattus norvegicus]|uniref:RCG30796 n=1 Tax=Rattus norvegicus TaxID=10116 RepID=A6IU12_RAT|nr:rCG30796 [Rattus norvegicus]